MTEQTDKPTSEKKPLTVGEALKALYESIMSSEIDLPKAIIIAAILIALVLIFD